MIFSSKAIRQAIAAGALCVTPYDKASINSAHIDLHLQLPAKLERMTIAPKQFQIAKTVETITLGNSLAAFMEGRSTLAQLGISIEQSSTFIEPGTNSHMVLEMFNASGKAVDLKNGQKIAKMFVFRLVDGYAMRS